MDNIWGGGFLHGRENNIRRDLFQPFFSLEKRSYFYDVHLRKYYQLEVKLLKRQK